jgi:hypothetical protein
MSNLLTFAILSSSSSRRKKDLQSKVTKEAITLDYDGNEELAA